MLIFCATLSPFTVYCSGKEQVHFLVELETSRPSFLKIQDQTEGFLQTFEILILSKS